MAKFSHTSDLENLQNLKQKLFESVFSSGTTGAHSAKDIAAAADAFAHLVDTHMVLQKEVNARTAPAPARPASAPAPAG